MIVIMPESQEQTGRLSAAFAAARDPEHSPVEGVVLAVPVDVVAVVPPGFKRDRLSVLLLRSREASSADKVPEGWPESPCSSGQRQVVTDVPVEDRH